MRPCHHPGFFFSVEREKCDLVCPLTQVERNHLTQRKYMNGVKALRSTNLNEGHVLKGVFIKVSVESCLPCLLRLISKSVCPKILVVELQINHTF